MAALIPEGDLLGPLWEPSVQVRVDLTGEGSLRDIEVTGQWSGAFVGTVTGRTNPTGKVTLSAPPISQDVVTFRVLAVSHAEYAYQPSLNVITQIAVNRGDAG